LFVHEIVVPSVQKSQTTHLRKCEDFSIHLNFPLYEHVTWMYLMINCELFIYQHY
jgi:hypothetical protein